uniref:Uncharacterized protein n=1 Tax=Trichuris muris TaxID=70415 RepID=A0A5S6Q5Z1_TRIMR
MNAAVGKDTVTLLNVDLCDVVSVPKTEEPTEAWRKPSNMAMASITLSVDDSQLLYNANGDTALQIWEKLQKQLRLERKNCTVKLLVKNARITQVYTSVHCTPSKWNKSNAFSMSGLRQCGLTNVVTYDWTSCYCMATVAPPMTPPQK